MLLNTKGLCVPLVRVSVNLMSPAERKALARSLNLFLKASEKTFITILIWPFYSWNEASSNRSYHTWTTVSGIANAPLSLNFCNIRPELCLDPFIFFLTVYFCAVISAIIIASIHLSMYKSQIYHSTPSIWIKLSIHFSLPGWVWHRNFKSLLHFVAVSQYRSTSDPICLFLGSLLEFLL